MEDLYSKFGASSAKEEVHFAIQNLDKGIAPGAFCKVLPDILGKDANFLNVMHADGAGTKSILAYLYWRETGDLSVWKGIAQDSMVMNIDDLLCIGAYSDFIVTSTIGRNKRLIPGEIIKAIIEGTEEFCSMMRQLGIPTIFAGGETADVGDVVKTILVDSNVTCRFPKSNLITASDIKPGDAILGFSSSGKTIYEDEWNSGISSNGITLARHILLKPEYSEKFPESIDSHFLNSGGYSGTLGLTDSILKNHNSLGLGLLSPTRTYAPLIGEMMKNVDKKKISAFIHNTGGGHSKVKNFIGNVQIEKKVNWAIPEVFRLIQRNANMDEPELLKTFNSGIRLEMYCNQEIVPLVKEISNKFNIDVYEIGTVRPSDKPEVRIQSGDLVWNY
jgi:phosphoribosylformylglycinamidine cyclo-ligase